MPERIRTLFLSDLHLGSPHCRAHELLDVLRYYEPEAIYLVGDAIDGRELKSRWRWPEIYNQILARLSELRDQGTELFYTPGNHDEFVRSLLKTVPAKFVLGAVKVAPEFIHITASGQRLLVIHGDQFDAHECHAGIISSLTAMIYDKLLYLDYWLRRAGMRMSHYEQSVCYRIKMRMGRLQRFFTQYRDRCLMHARARKMDGIICGHIHQPLHMTVGQTQYLNTGDWLEHCSAIIEDEQGTLKLCFHHDLNTAEVGRQQDQSTGNQPKTGFHSDFEEMCPV